MAEEKRVVLECSEGHTDTLRSIKSPSPRDPGVLFLMICRARARALSLSESDAIENLP